MGSARFENSSYGDLWIATEDSQFPSKKESILDITLSNGKVDNYVNIPKAGNDLKHTGKISSIETGNKKIHDVSTFNGEISLKVHFPTFEDLDDIKSSNWVYKIFEISFFDIVETADDNITLTNRFSDCGRVGSLLLVTEEAIITLFNAKAKFVINSKVEDNKFPELEVTFFGDKKIYPKGADDTHVFSDLGSETIGDLINALHSNFVPPTFPIEKVVSNPQIALWTGDTLGAFSDVEVNNEIILDSSINIKSDGYHPTPNTNRIMRRIETPKPIVTIGGDTYAEWHNLIITDEELNKEFAFKFDIGANLSIIINRILLDDLQDDEANDVHSRTVKKFLALKDGINGNYQIIFKETS